MHNRYSFRLRREWRVGFVLTTLLVGLLSFAPFWKPVSDFAYDHLLRQHTFEPSPEMMVVAVDDRTITELGGWPLQRTAYAELLEGLNNPLYKPRAVGLNLLFVDPSDHDVRLAAALRQHQAVLPVGFGVSSDGAPVTVLPVRPIDEAAQLSHINAVFESDGSVRGIRERDEGYLHFALAMQRLTQGEAPTSATVAASPVRRVHMVDPGLGFETVSLSDALNPLFPREVFKDKYVLLGVTSTTLGDRFATLYSGVYNTNTPGVMVLASALQAALQGDFIDTAPGHWVLGLNAMVLWLALVSVLFWSPQRALLWAALLVALWLGASGYALVANRWWLDPTPFVAAVLLFHPLWAWRRMQAMANVMERTTSDLSRVLPEHHQSAEQGRSEFVVQHALRLDEAVKAASSELALLSSVVAEMPEAVAIWSEPNGLLLCNERFGALWPDGAPSTGTAMQHMSPWLGVPLEVLQQDGARMLSLATPRNGQVEVMLKTSPIESPQLGRLWVMVLSDVTELRQFQAQRDKALQFLSHDMRTPLASILTLNRQGQATGPKIEQHARTLLQMMDDFCMAIQAEAPSYQLRHEMLENFIEDAMDRVTDLADTKHILLQFEPSESAVFVHANAQLLVRAITNLLQNAVKFAPLHSTVEVLVQEKAPHLAVVQGVTVIISNAVDANYQDKSLPGFGLGLDFVDKVVAKHGGRIEREIPPHGQARVTLELPCTFETA
jgi:CHASE2 domain-containing sensor protein/signal transduction histidine kinase